MYLYACNLPKVRALLWFPLTTPIGIMDVYSNITCQIPSHTNQANLKAIVVEHAMSKQSDPFQTIAFFRGWDTGTPAWSWSGYMSKNSTSALPPTPLPADLTMQPVCILTISPHHPPARGYVIIITEFGF